MVDVYSQLHESRIRRPRSCPARVRRPVLLRRVPSTVRLVIICGALQRKEDAHGLLRKWLDLSAREFQCAGKIAVVSVGFPQTGQGTRGGWLSCLKCAPSECSCLQEVLPNLRLTLLVGLDAQTFYLGKRMKASLDETVRAFDEYLPEFFPLPHPAAHGARWQKANPWFQKTVLGILRRCVALVLRGRDTRSCFSEKLILT